MSLRVGIKYCGGCNPTYHREGVEKAVRSEFKHLSFYYISDEDLRSIEPSIVILINGCKKGCASDSIKNCGSNEVEVLRIDEEAELEDLISRMKELFADNLD